MTNTTLKIIAILSMLIDHTGAILFPEVAPFRIIGRLAFPIFCFLIIEGYFHTRDLRKYITRLFIFGLVSEIPFDLAFHNTWLEFSYQNVFFTLALGLIAVYLYDKSVASALHIGTSLCLSTIFILIKFSSEGTFNLAVYLVTALLLITVMVISYRFRHLRNRALNIGSLISICLLATAFTSDYFFLGILIIFFTYYYHKNFSQLSRFMVIMSIFMILTPLLDLLGGNRFALNDFTSVFMVFALIPIYFYNGQKGPSLKYLFYAFYPVHLILLFLIKTFTLSH